MRRILVVSILLLMMTALNALKVTDSLRGDPLMLAAIGFILLASFSVAELMAQWRLPRVTGYIVTGIFLGPELGNILSGEVVREMRMFNTLALGLIAINAGLELRVESLRRVWATLAATTALKLLLVAVLVGGAFYGLESLWNHLQLTELKLICMTAIMATLAIGTSPSISVAVLSETRAKGRLADLVLGAAVMKDVVLVVCLAVTVSLCRAALTGGGQVEMETLRFVALELGSSVIGGALLGGLLIAYLRYVRAEMLLFAAAMILAVAEVSQALHMELLLVFITAGFVVRNFSSQGEALLHPIEKVALPVFVVFFSNVGAGLDLSRAYTVLPLAVAICVGRAIAFFFAARWGSRLGRETPAVRRLVWLGYLPQAGVTLGMVGLAATQLPELRLQIETLGVAMVAINLLIGPVTLRAALKGAGEIPEPSVSPEAESPAPAAPAPRLVRVTPAEGRERLESLSSEPVRRILEELRGQLHHSLEEMVEVSHRPALESLQQEANRFLSSWQDTEAHFQGALQFLKAGFKNTREAGENTTTLKDRFHQHLLSLPSEMRLPLEERHVRPQPGDSRLLRWEKFWLQWIFRLTPRSKRWRTVPARLAGRFVLEEPLTLFVGEFHNRWYRLHCQVLEQLRQVVAGKKSEKEAKKEIDALAENWRSEAAAELDAVFFGHLPQLARILENSGTVNLPSWKLRLSEVEPRVRRAARELQSDNTEWATKLQAVKSTFRVGLLAEYIEKEAIRIIGNKYFKPVESTTASIREELGRVRAQLEGFRGRLSDRATLSVESLKQLGEDLKRWSEGYFASQRRFRKTHINHYLLNREIALMFNLVLPKDVEHFLIVSSQTPAHEAMRPREILVSRVHLRGVFEQHLVSEVLPLVEEELEGLSSLLNASELELRESVEVVTYALEAELSVEEQRPPETVAEAVDQGFERALQKLARYEEDLSGRVTSSKEELGTIFHKALDRFRGSLVRVSSVESARSWARILLGGMWEKMKVEYFSLSHTARRRLGGLWRTVRSLWLRGVPVEEEEWQIRGEPDAGSLREYLRRQTQYPQDEDLPTVYRKLFSLEPLRDRRFFVVNRPVLDLIRNTEREWREGAPVSGVLVHGDPGTGRTSLLNVCQLELVTERVVRLDDSHISRSRGILAALGQELLTTADSRLILQRLKERRTVVLIDNLDYWLSRDPQGLAEMRELFHAMVSTMGSAFWVATLRTINLELFGPLFSVESIFSHRAELRELDTQQIQNVVETRHRVSGMTLEFEHNWGPGWLSRMGVFDPSSVFFRVLADASGGNLRHALHLWVESLSRSPLDSNRLRPTLKRMSRPEAAFLEAVPKNALAVLSELIRFGAADTAGLVDRLRIRGTDFQRQLQFLEMSGLVERTLEGREAYQIPVRVQYLIYRGLKAAGVV